MWETLGSNPPIKGASQTVSLLFLNKMHVLRPIKITQLLFLCLVSWKLGYAQDIIIDANKYYFSVQTSRRNHLLIIYFFGSNLYVINVK